MDKRKIALLSALGATTIYGLNHTIAKEVMPHFIQGFGFVQLRLLGATILFWAVSFFIPKQALNWMRLIQSLSLVATKRLAKKIN